jgi:hypothetical protein
MTRRYGLQTPLFQAIACATKCTGTGERMMIQENNTSYQLAYKQDGAKLRKAMNWAGW